MPYGRIFGYRARFRSNNLLSGGKKTDYPALCVVEAERSAGGGVPSAASSFQRILLLADSDDPGFSSALLRVFLVVKNVEKRIINR